MRAIRTQFMGVPNVRATVVLVAILAATFAIPVVSWADRNDKASPTAPRDATEPGVAEGNALTTNQGQRVEDDDNSLKAGHRGPTLMEDFHFREKMTQFDHERMPERVVHARGTGAHGYFQLYKSLARYSKA